MRDLALSPAPPRALDRLLLSGWPMLLVAWGFLVFLRWPSWTAIGTVFSDTDDAMRLVQLRDLMAGQGWFDLHQYRLDPVTPVTMHWSRLVDLPMLVIARAAGWVVDPVTAEKVAMAVWPALTALPMLAAVRFGAVRLGGAWAAPCALILAVLALFLTWQFAPGRIDHHNVQLALSLWTMVLLFDRGVRAAALSAACAVLALAVGMEVLPFLLGAGAALAWSFVAGDEDGAGRIAAFGATLAAGAAVLCAATVPPSDWLLGACDAFSATYVVPLVAGGGILAIGACLPSVAGRPVGRLALVAVAGAVAVAALAAVDPACLRGPYGQVDPRLKPIWLDHINEMQPITGMFRTSPMAAVIACGNPVLGLAAAVFLMRDPALRRRPELWAYLAALLAVTVLGLFQVRTLVHATLFSLPLIAGAVGVVARRAIERGASGPVVALACGLLLNSATLIVVLHPVVPAGATPAPGGPRNAASLTSTEREPCMVLGNYAPMAALRPGLVANLFDMGPFILAATGHSVLAAPYHRFSRGILEAHGILHTAPDEARRLALARGVDYVAVCDASPALALHRQVAPDGLAVRLADGQTPEWLEPVEGSGPIRVFRVRER